MTEDPIDNLELGGQITLSGFKSLDGAKMTVLKKIVGNYTKKFTEHHEGFQGLKLTLKQVHKREKGEVFEIHAHLYQTGNDVHIETTDRNLFVAVDNAFKKIDHTFKS